MVDIGMYENENVSWKVYRAEQMGYLTRMYACI